LPTERGESPEAVPSPSTTSSPITDTGAEFTLDVVETQIDGYADEVAQNRKTNLNTALKKLKKTMSFHVPCAAIHPVWRHNSEDLHCRLECHSHADTHKTDI
jgi:hypothetical protein